MQRSIAPSVLRGLLVVLLMVSASHSLLSQECHCTTECPNAGYTQCLEGFASHNQTILDVYIQKLNRNCLIEVHYCCRIRPVNNPYCMQFVTGPIGASCETTITCIKIPKSCIADVVQPEQPITDPVLRRQIYDGIMQQLMCSNPCNNGLPGPGEQPYEWIFSVPACLYYLKTGGPTTAFCLESCGTRHCVNAFKMAVGPLGGPRVLQTVVTTWNKTTPGYCNPAPDCVYDPCPDPGPTCATWEY